VKDVTMTATHEPSITHSELLTGTFRDRESAEQAYNSLTSRGYTKDDINVIMSDDTRKRHFSETTVTTDLGTKVTAGGLTGATVGGTVGAIAVYSRSLAPWRFQDSELSSPVRSQQASRAWELVQRPAACSAHWGRRDSRRAGQGLQDQIESGGIVVGVTPRSADDATHFEREWTEYHGENIHR
jgi:hypothetical protein